MAKGKARPLAGQVALVAGAATGVGRAAALALASRGVKVVAADVDERAVAELVGEAAAGGGTARHVVAALHAPELAQAAVVRAMEAFGGLDIVVAAPAEGAAGGGDRAARLVSAQVLGTHYLFDAALRAMTSADPARGGRLLALLVPPHGPDAGFPPLVASHAAVRALVKALAPACRARAVTCNALSVSPACEPEALGGLLAFLCSAHADALTGQELDLACA